MINIDSLNQIESVADPACAFAAAGIAVSLFKMTPGAIIRFENLERLPKEPVIVAMNHTHFYDFIPLRAPLLFKGQSFVSWVKSRAYQSTKMGLFLRKTGNVPICSRGYIIAADYFDLIGERIDEQTYRALRNHIDCGLPLPQDARFERILSTPRSMLGWQFNPSCTTYEEAIASVYFEMMQISLRKTRRCINRGDHVHIYPQGSVSGQLTPGRPGIIQAAIAFGLPILTVGVSGTREVYPTSSFPKPCKGEIIVRFGNMHMVPRDEVPADFRPFHPADERKHQSRLMLHTQKVMEDLNAQLEPSYQWADDMKSDAKTGIGRFF